MIPILISIALPVFLWSLIASVQKNQRYEMDWSGNAISFSYLQSYYHRLFMVIFWVGLALSIYIGTIFRQEPAGILALSAIYALVFNLWLTFCYESYLHARYPKQLPSDSSSPVGVHYASVPTSNYTRSRYALTLALAFSSVILFIIGILGTVSIIVNR